jgi:2-keto-4-pentenoate hydratase/2-oxohepta-3-ene-1,7-dioic acid hydratase in catechol pathway
MRLVTFQTTDGRAHAGATIAAGIVDLAATDSTLPGSVREILAGDLVARAAAAAASPKAVFAAGAKLLAPILDPEKIVCIGLNYRDHAVESGMAIPKEPIVFSKFNSALVGPEADIRLPAVSQAVDYEAELVVVIGRAGRDIALADCMRHVAGYTVGHDVSARDWQLQKEGKQWLLGKTFDTFAPIGPALVTADEVPDPHRLGIRLRVNGQTMQESTTEQLIFRVDQLVAYLSQVMTLRPGDLIFTGTPPGVGFARKPPVFLKPGDVCEVEIDGLGCLRNTCVAG